MKSKARLQSHPLHPILVSFPIAFFAGTFLFDCLRAFTDNSTFTLTGYYLNIAGIVSAVAAAIPGIIDYFFTVPPQSSASKRAAKHGLINTSVLVLFSGILWYRQSGNAHPWVIVGLGAVAVTLLLIAGWLGGTLVFRNQIGIDIRYAGAGKWQEEYLKDANGLVRVAKADELKPDQMKLIHVAGRRIVIGRTESGYVAFEDRCPHRGGSLAAGAMICGTVQCPWHGSQFDVGTGAVKAGPAKTDIKTYAVQQTGDEIFLSL
jgi:nitrite reductase/ring-hydroxylating ferredoxin subunit/uncharacterized membrane protein